MASTTSYNSEKAVIGEVEYPAIDPASGAFFQPDYKKNDDLKMMLDSSKDSLKLEAMKRIIGMIAKGRDASDLFPAVVKNVVSKNIEVKKLVYVYLVRYAEEQQDLALLSISTFQRALKDPNQLIRASALRVLSSIRVPMIVPIVMLAIRDSVSDMSPYVRKTAAHAIPKLYSLDPEQKEELVCVIEKLLADKAPLVVGSAAMAFSELCPERLPLLHKCFRKLCTLLADVDEWGQCALLDVLTEYSRAFLPDPNLQSQSTDSERSFYAESDSSAEKQGPAGGSGGSGGVDPELRLILRAAKPLLQSRSTAVVMAVAKLYFHCGPAQELPPVVKALIRLLRGPVEVQSVVLNAISALTAHKKGLFEPYLKSFFVRTSDPTHIKLLKLEVLSRLASPANISAVLAELRTYRAAGDKKLAAAAIRAVATAALAVPSETQTCLNSLLHLLSSKQEWAVCEAVLAVKRVVGAGSAAAAVRRACRLLRQDRVAGSARAAALWLVAEHGSQHPRAAAVLAHMARTFPDQEEVVKLQLLSLAGKLSVTQPDTLPLGRYLCQLSRYDTSYDVRDRGRMLSALLGRRALVTRHRHAAAAAHLPDHAEREQFTLGTLSQYLCRAAAGYRPLADPHADAIAVQLRAVGDDDTPITTAAPSGTTANKDKEFYSEPESSGSGSSSSSSEDSSSGSEESSDEEESGNNDKKKSTKSKEGNNYESSDSSSSDSEASSSDDSGSWPDSSDDDNKELANGGGKTPPPGRPRAQAADKSNLELLLELEAAPAPALPAPALAPLTLFSPTAAGNGNTDIHPCPASYVSSTEKEVLSRVAGGGLSAAARWPRHAHLQSSRALALRLTLQNHTDDDATDVVVTAPDVVNSGRAFFGWGSVSVSARGVAHLTLGLDCADSIQPLRFTITSSLGETKFSITPPVGELMQAVSMSETTWDLQQSKLRGMNECDKKMSRVLSDATICQRVFETANVGSVTSTGTFLRFAGQMLSSGDLVLVSVLVKDDGLLLRVNCPNMAISSLMASQLAFAIDK